MSLAKLLLRKNRVSTTYFVLNSTQATSRKYSTTKFQKVEEVDKPIEYSKSPANQWQAKYSRIGTDSERLWYEPYVIIGSITVFMIYFCLLREESDIDKEFDKSLYSRIKGLEEQQLILSLKYNQEHGLDTKAIEQRLKEIAEGRT